MRSSLAAWQSFRHPWLTGSPPRLLKSWERDCTRRTRSWLHSSREHAFQSLDIDLIFVHDGGSAAACIAAAARRPTQSASRAGIPPPPEIARLRANRRPLIASKALLERP